MSTILPAIAQLSSRVIRILGCNPGPMTLQGTNTYLIGTGAMRILIDAGEAKNEDYINLLTDYLMEQKVSLSHILVTHWHPDHMGGVEDVLHKLGIRETCHVLKAKSNRDRLKSPVESEGSGGHGHGGNDDENKNRDIIVDSTIEDKFDEVKDGDEIRTEGATIRLIHSPGHTDDHMAALLLEEESLFSGDCVLGEGTAVFEDLKQLLESLQKFISLKPSIIYPGHGPVVVDPSLKLQLYINHRLDREKQVLDALSHDYSCTGLTIDSIVKQMYMTTPERLLRAAGLNVYHHLRKLQADHKVSTFDKDNVTYYQLKKES